MWPLQDPLICQRQRALCPDILGCGIVPGQLNTGLVPVGSVKLGHSREPDLEGLRTGLEGRNAGPGDKEQGGGGGQVTGAEALGGGQPEKQA